MASGIEKMGVIYVEKVYYRDWEEELKIPAKRNEMGHRYYTEEDIGRFRRVKELKEQENC